MSLTVLIQAGLQRFLDGDFFGGILYFVTVAIGDWAYAIGFGAMFVMLYMRNGNVAMPLVVFVVLMPLILWFIPAAAWQIVGVFVAVSIISIFVKVFSNRG